MAKSQTKNTNKLTARGRPKRNPVEKLRTRTFMNFLCWHANIAFTGYQLEHHFEPEHIKLNKKSDLQVRRCKWDRYVNGTATPNKDTCILIKSRYPHSLCCFDSPLWQALKAGEQTEDYWSDFYKSV